MQDTLQSFTFSFNISSIISSAIFTMVSSPFSKTESPFSKLFIFLSIFNSSSSLISPVSLLLPLCVQLVPQISFLVISKIYEVHIVSYSYFLINSASPLISSLLPSMENWYIPLYSLKYYLPAFKIFSCYPCGFPVSSFSFQ